MAASRASPCAYSRKVAVSDASCELVVRRDHRQHPPEHRLRAAGGRFVRQHAAICPAFLAAKRSAPVGYETVRKAPSPGFPTVRQSITVKSINGKLKSINTKSGNLACVSHLHPARSLLLCPRRVRRRLGASPSSRLLTNKAAVTTGLRCAIRTRTRDCHASERLVADVLAVSADGHHSSVLLTFLA
jgi:hypothetical protein